MELGRKEQLVRNFVVLWQGMTISHVKDVVEWCPKCNCAQCTPTLSTTFELKSEQELWKEALTEGGGGLRDAARP